MEAIKVALAARDILKGERTRDLSASMFKITWSYDGRRYHNGDGVHNPPQKTR